MAQTILITPETMRSQAAQIRACSEEHAEIMGRMTNLVLTLDEVWQGEAQKIFVSKFQGMTDSFRSFEDTLLSFAQLMEQVANKMESVDQSMRSKINNV